MRILFLMDPLDKIILRTDSTFALMLAAQDKGHDLYYGQTRDLKIARGRPYVSCQRVRVKYDEQNYYEVEKMEVTALDDFPMIFMRKDPPLTTDYIFATQILALTNPNKTCVVNDPSGLLFASEKLFITHFPEMIPETMVTKDPADIKAFLKDVGKAVVKPLDGCGGKGIYLLDLWDPNYHSLIETATHDSTEYVMVQKYIEQVREGDKRILLLNGEYLGAVLRVSTDGDLRSNLHVGGRAKQADVTERDHEIIQALKPHLQKHGLYFVGLDVIGGFLTEINVTSPTGLQEAGRFDGRNLAGQVISFCTNMAPAG